MAVLVFLIVDADSPAKGARRWLGCYIAPNDKVGKSRLRQLMLLAGDLLTLIRHWTLGSRYQSI